MKIQELYLPQPQVITETVSQHLTNKISLLENPFRMYSEGWSAFFREARRQIVENQFDLAETDRELLQTDIGEWVTIGEHQVPLDVPVLLELTYKGKKVQLNRPKRGGSKKFYVYVRNPKTGNVKKISFGDTTGLSVKLRDPKRRASFAARHRCEQANDKMTARYWACRLPRYAKSMGLSGGGQWW